MCRESGGTPADRQRHVRADRVLLELVVFDLRLLWQAVVVDLHPLRLPGAVVGDRDERPGVGLELIRGDDLERIVGIVMDQVHPDPPTVDGDVPAPVCIRDIHPGDHRVARIVGGRADPERRTEALVMFEIAAGREFPGLAIEEQGGRAARARLPSGRGRERQIALLAGNLHAGRAAGPLEQWQVDHRRVLWKRPGHDLGRDLLHPGLELRLCRLPAGSDDLLRRRDGLLQFGEPRPVLRLRHRKDRRGVVHVAVHRRLGRVVEKGGEFVKLLLRERIELVVVADGAACRQSHPDR